MQLMSKQGRALQLLIHESEIGEKGWWSNNIRRADSFKGPRLFPKRRFKWDAKWAISGLKEKSNETQESEERESETSGHGGTKNFEMERLIYDGLETCLLRTLKPSTVHEVRSIVKENRFHKEGQNVYIAFCVGSSAETNKSDPKHICWFGTSAPAGTGRRAVEPYKISCSLET